MKFVTPKLHVLHVTDDSRKSMDMTREAMDTTTEMDPPGNTNSSIDGTGLDSGYLNPIAVSNYAGNSGDCVHEDLDENAYLSLDAGNAAETAGPSSITAGSGSDGAGTAAFSDEAGGYSRIAVGGSPDPRKDQSCTAEYSSITLGDGGINADEGEYEYLDQDGVTTSIYLTVEPKTTPGVDNEYTDCISVLPGTGQLPFQFKHNLKER